MILIADSGSFKTHWRFISGETPAGGFNTTGMNPFFISPEEISQEIRSNIPSDISTDEISEVYFYGSGCGSQAKGQMMIDTLQGVFRNARVQVFTDLLASARACFGTAQGLVAILGTGSHSGYYDGSEVRTSVPSLGYILGDEGSGSQMGKMLLTAYFLDEMPKDLHEGFQRQYHLTREHILDELYSKSRPNRFLASFTPFLWWNKSHPYIREMINHSLKGLVNRYLSKYPQFFTEPIRCTGSVAHFFEEEMKDMIASSGGRLDLVLHHPVEQLVNYHLSHS